MRVFLTWSGARSRELAVYLKIWLREVLHQLEPWVSDRDIDAGKVWPTEVVTNLQNAAAGIVCVTPENQLEPWVLFEAGALASSVGGKSKVCVYLLGMQPRDLRPGPLSLYQATTTSQADTLKMVQSLNASCGEQRVPDEILKRSFDQHWPSLYGLIETLCSAESVAANLLRSSEQVLEEVLAEVRRVVKQNDELIAALQRREEERAYLTQSQEAQHELAASARSRLNSVLRRRRPTYLPLIDRATLVGDRDGSYELIAHDDATFRDLIAVQSELDEFVREARLSWAVTIRRP